MAAKRLSGVLWPPEGLAQPLGVAGSQGVPSQEVTAVELQQDSCKTVAGQPTAQPHERMSCGRKPVPNQAHGERLVWHKSRINCGRKRATAVLTCGLSDTTSASTCIALDGSGCQKWLL
eukprot:359193-Chlamydomonas_euryale.AAC.6